MPQPASGDHPAPPTRQPSLRESDAAPRPGAESPAVSTARERQQDSPDQPSRIRDRAGRHGSAGPGADEPRPERNPYAGQGTVPLNARVPVSLHNRYKNLARELTRSGYRTTANELYLALLHYGPTTIHEARDLAARFRAEKDQYRGEPGRPTTPRVYSSVHRRYQRLAWALDDAGVEDATMTELLLALLHLGPTDAEGARGLARRWRTLLAA